MGTQTWISRSNPARQGVVALLCLAAGAALAAGFHGSIGTGMSNGMAGFLLGVLLVAIGAGGLAVLGLQTVVVDPAAQRILIEDRTLWGRKRQMILFHDIVDISIGYLGKRSNFANFYFLVLNLRSGREYTLFAPGRFYEGSSDRSVVEGWRRRLEGLIRP
jgi:hypothetical protein